MTPGEERYARNVDSIRVEPFPPLGREEARRAFARIIKHFGKWHYAAVGTEGYDTQRDCLNGYIGRARRVWVSPGITSFANHFKGWGRLIHDASHLIHRYRHPSMLPHAPSHARLERQIALYVIEQGWLTIGGSLAPKRTKPMRPSAAERTANSIERWTAKLTRAQNALRKLHARQRAQQRRASLAVTGETHAPQNTDA